MARPKVYNQKKMFPGENENELVFVGRPSKWGNPFAIGQHGNRNQVIAKYRKYLEGRQDLQEAAKVELRGKDLLCFCHPLPCHAGILLEVANSG